MTSIQFVNTDEAGTLSNTFYTYDEDSNATEHTADLTSLTVEASEDELLAVVNAALGTTYTATSGADGEGHEGEYVFGFSIA